LNPKLLWVLLKILPRNGDKTKFMESLEGIKPFLPVAIQERTPLLPTLAAYILTWQGKIIEWPLMNM
jgi:hypothetical protein